jgi:hypothetical protein
LKGTRATKSDKVINYIIIKLKTKFQMGNVKAKFRGESARLDITEGIKALQGEQIAGVLQN